MYFDKILAAGALVALANAASLPSGHVLHEKREAPAHRWAKRNAVQDHIILPMRIGMAQQNLDKGDEYLADVSSHDSPNFGKYYTAEQIHDLFAPSNETVEAVRSWLQAAGIASHRVTQSVNKQWMELDIPVQEANDLLKTKYHVFEHIASGDTHLGCEEYHVPEHLKRHVDYVTPGVKTIKTAEKKKLVKKQAKGGNKLGGLPPIIKPGNVTIPSLGSLNMCDTIITPNCIAAEYKIPKATKHRKGNELGIFEEGDFYAAEDLVEFFTLVAPNIPPTTEPILHGVDGGFAPGLVATGESDLDFQITYPIIYPQQSILFQTDDILYATGVSSSGGIFNTFLDAIDGSYCTSGGIRKIDPKYPNPNPLGYQGKTQCGVYKPTNVISVSYGLQEDDLPLAYQKRQCREYMKLGMQGTSVIFASGDSGVAARSTDDNNSNGCLGSGPSAGKVFNPDFPAACPYLTALGSTVLTGDVNKDQEISTTSFPSGGGFSNIYPRPSYQNAAVNAYFANAKGPKYPHYTTSNNNNPGPDVTGKGIYNRGGRGYPDFAAVGDNVLVVVDGAPTLIGGTSAAAPVFAAILNRINEERLAVGKSTVGFVNPTLYAHPGVLHDITNGTNPGCGTNGFSATDGWDAVSGLGTPQYDKMLKLYMSLP